jgi:hypothetical protein
MTNFYYFSYYFYSQLYPSSCKSIPQGPGTLYIKNESGCGFRALNHNEEKFSNELYWKKENMFLQWLALTCFPDSKRICSNLHAGPAQCVFGLDRRDRVDAVVFRFA